MAITQRDARGLVRIGALEALSRLVASVASQTARLVNVSGLAAAVLGLGADDLEADRHAFGQLLETFVVQELLRQAAAHDDDLRLHHFRDRDGYEVDVVIERAGREVAGVEVKAAATVTDADFRGLRQLARAAGDAFVAGVVLYDGEVSAPFGERLHAVPLRYLWEAA